MDYTRMTTLRNRIGHWLRKYADRIDDHGAPRCMSTYTFTFETGEGLRFRQDGRGCKLWFLGADDYEKAHTEADSAAADAEKAHRARLIETAMTEPDPVKAGEAAAELRGIFESGGQTRQMGPRPSISAGSGSGTDWRPSNAASVWIVSGGGGGGGHYLPPNDGPAPALVPR